MPINNNNNQFVMNFDASQKSSVIEFISRNFREIVIFRHALYNFINTNLSSRYRRSTIGFFWSLLNPLFTMLIMGIVFSALYKLPFKEFSLYLFSGLLAWNLITASLISGASSLITSEVYLKKVYIPKILFPLVTLGVEIVNFLFSLISLFILTIFFGANFGWSLFLLPFVLLLLGIFLFGLILTISITTIYFRDLAHILQIGLLGLFYFTPILYKVSMLTEQLQALIKYNPFYYFISLFQTIIYEARLPNLIEWVPCILLSFISISLGIFVFKNYENNIIYRL